MNLFLNRMHSDRNKSGDSLQARSRNKLRSKVGETITETLVALLVAALALTMLAGAIGSASSIIMHNRMTFNTYYSENEKLMNMNSTDKGSATITISDENQQNSSFTVGVDTYTNDALSTPVTAYKVADPGTGGGFGTGGTP